MNSHIAITTRNKPCTLPEDFSIDMQDENPVFNDGNETFSFPFAMPLEGNRFFLGNIDDQNNGDRPVNLERTPMQLFVEGLPIRSGLLVTSEDEVIENTLSMNIQSAEHTLSDIIGNMTCRDIPIKDNIQIGEKIGNVEVQANIKYEVHATAEKDMGCSGTMTRDFHYHGTFHSDKVKFSPQATGFSYPAKCAEDSAGVASKAGERSYANNNVVVVPQVTQSFINVDTPYPSAPYCNARVCYYHHGVKEDNPNETSDELATEGTHWGPNEHYPYWVLEADRPASGICFYVLYFLDCLFAYLGYTFDNSALLEIEDLKRLCFFTTHCKYSETLKPNSPTLVGEEAINNWLNSRGCGGTLKFELGYPTSVQEMYFKKPGTEEMIHIKVGDDFDKIEVIPELESLEVKANIMEMFANSDNFPDVRITEVLDSLYSSFGIKFYVDYERKHVKAYLMRAVFRSQSAPIDINGKVISVKQVAEKITGFRMRYSAESDAQEQRDNIRNKVKDYDTDYDYIDYPIDGTVLHLTYEDIYRLPKKSDAAGNMATYIDRTTGNAYRIKINGEAETQSEFKPVLFEVGTFKGVEIGDCSPLNEDFIIEMQSDFQPISFNDVNYNHETSLATGEMTDDQGNKFIFDPNDEHKSTILCAYVDEDMEHEFIESRVKQSLGFSYIDSTMDMVLKMVESYDPTNTSDGDSPLQSYDWGLSIAIMQGGGNDAKIEFYDANYDGFGNSKWQTVAGEYALSSDSMDMWGNPFDYNGVQPGGLEGERFSLKIRSWKQPYWVDENGMYWVYEDEKPTIDPEKYHHQESIIMADEREVPSGEIVKKIKSRGLFDTFLSEYAFFILNRRKYTIKMLCNAATLADIPNYWDRRFRIAGMIGYINKVSYTITAEEGVKEAEFEFFVV